MDKDLKKLAQEMFNNHKGVDVFFITNDKQFFERGDLAKAHQDYLNSKQEDPGDVRPYVLGRELAFAPDKEEAPAADVIPTDKSKKEEIVAYLTAKEVAFDLKANKADLLKLVADYQASLEKPEDEKPEDETPGNEDEK